MKICIPDQVVVIHRTLEGKPIYQIVVDGELLPATWLQRGPAEAAIDVERRRNFARKEKALLVK